MKHIIMFRKVEIILATFILCMNPLMAQDSPLKQQYTVRIDYQSGHLNPWLFYEVPLKKSIGFLSVFQTSTQGFAEIDLGPNFHFGQLQIITQVGFEIVETDDKGGELGHIVPQGYLIYYDKHWSFESWNLYFVKANSKNETYFYFRDFLLYSFIKKISIGPQIEGNVYLNRSSENFFGGHIDIDVGIGTIGLFYGSEDQTHTNCFRMTFLKFF